MAIDIFLDNVVFEHVNLPGPYKEGETVVFHDRLVNAAGQEVGTHSGFATLVRIMPADEPNLVQYQRTV